MIRKLLVANRGEIARRIFRTCREMGIATVAVFSDADRSSPFVREAHEAVGLGGTAPVDSYLRSDLIIAAASRTGADAIHPGYGFLSEQAAFAREVEAAGLVWVGPPPSAMAAMGSKLESKRLVAQAGVPVLAAVELAGLPAAEVEEAAADLGYPVLVKASAGGGGRGMRVVPHARLLAESVASARREAAAAFGDDTLFLEPYLEAPRHIEVQVLGDTRGDVVSLFERECSIQRRHQKIVEESPSPILTDDERDRMGEAAVRAAAAVGYVGAGTVELLYQDGAFSFLEMNTRLQVEHPVTEAITGLDLVRLQLLVAAGHPLPPEARRPQRSGHAIEARLYAEDPRNGFLPVTGTLHRFEVPRLPGVRVDGGVENGSLISPHYDPLLAKVIAWAPGREEAASLLASALQASRIHGLTTNRDLLVRILRHPEFLGGDADTRFLERHDPAELGRPLAGPEEERLAAVAAALASQAARRQAETILPRVPSGWRNSPSLLQEISFEGAQGRIDVAYRLGARGSPMVRVGGDPLAAVEVVEARPGEVGLAVEGILRWYRIERVGPVHHVDWPDGSARLEEIPRFPRPLLEEEPGSLHAPMPGKVVAVHVCVGDAVVQGQPLVVMEAMKMEHALRAPFSGRVRSVRASEGDQVEAETVLVVVDGEESSSPDEDG